MNQRQILGGKLLTLLIPFCVACSGGDDDGDDAPAATNEWNGKTYIVEMRDRDWSEPQGAVLEFAPYVRGFLFKVEGESSDSYNVTVGTLELNVNNADPPPAAKQDMCNPTAVLTGAGNAVGPGTMPMNIRHLDEDLSADTKAYNLAFTKIFPQAGLATQPDGVTSKEGTFQGTLDARDIAPLFTDLGMNPTKEDLCAALADPMTVSPPAPCEPCPDGQVWCLTLKAVNFGAKESPIPLATVPASVTSDPMCQGGLAQ